MAEPFRLYLDQMLRLDVAQALHREGHDAMRASDVGQSRADDYEILQKAIPDNDQHFLKTMSECGLFILST